MAFDDGFVDFRSDTVTRPTAEMRKAMADAAVGDDVFRGDPTVNGLQDECAALLGFESGLFVPSGVMANQLCVMAQTRPGDEVICDPLAHVRNIERGASSALSGIAYRPVESEAGFITAQHIAGVMELAGRFHPRVRLVCWENTHNFSGGRVVPVDVMAAGLAAAEAHGLAKHVDGARIFNAAVALGVEAAKIVQGADTVSFCFSKGLGAPVGSAVVGSSDTIEEIRYLRARLGGGMRQVGILAAAASIALRDRTRLAEDHELARYLAMELADRQGDLVDPASVETNIVNISAAAIRRPWLELASDFEQEGIAVYPPFDERFRIVTHRDVDRADVDRLVQIVTETPG